MLTCGGIRESVLRLGVCRVSFGVTGVAVNALVLVEFEATKGCIHARDESNLGDRTQLVDS